MPITKRYLRPSQHHIIPEAVKARGSDADGTTLTFTAVSPDDAIEVSADLD